VRDYWTRGCKHLGWGMPGAVSPCFLVRAHESRTVMSFCSGFTILKTVYGRAGSTDQEQEVMRRKLSPKGR
jgi:hypothetical protein